MKDFALMIEWLAEKNLPCPGRGDPMVRRSWREEGRCGALKERSKGGGAATPCLKAVTLLLTPKVRPAVLWPVVLRPAILLLVLPFLDKSMVPKEVQ